ncbi:MAG: hypothetical protein ABIH68_02255 [bacterium]
MFENVIVFRGLSRLWLAPQSCGHTVNLLGLTAPSGTIRRLVVAHTAPADNDHFHCMMDK